MSFPGTDPTLDASTLAGRVDDIERPNEIESPEAPFDSGLSASVITLYFQHKNFVTFCTDFILNPGAAGTITMTVLGSRKTGISDPTLIANYVDKTAALGMGAGVVATGAVTVVDEIVAETLFRGCEWVKILLTLTGAGADMAYAFEKKGLAL